MASSLIPVNQATPEELQGLKGIGPKRSQRIIEYRERVSPIRNIDDLAAAAGISLRQANRLSPWIEWTDRDTGRRHLVIPAITILGSCLLVGYSLLKLDSGPGTLLSLIYNAALGLMVTGCLALITEQVLTVLLKNRIRFRYLTALTAGCLASGFLVLVTLSILSLYPETRPGLTGQMLATVNFILFLLIMVYLLPVPALWFSRLNMDADGIRQRISTVTSGFDVSQFPLGLLVLFILTKLNSATLLEEIFAVWIGVILTSNGFDLFRGKSTWVHLLTSHQKQTLEFILEGTGKPLVPQAVTRPAGIAVTATGILLLILAAIGLIPP